MNYIKRFKNPKVLLISVGNTHPWDQLTYTFLGKFHQGGKYSD